MGKCLKCGQQHSDTEFSTCEKCGAVQKKVRAFLADKAGKCQAACDDLIATCKSTEQSVDELRAFVDNQGNGGDWQTFYITPLCELSSKLDRIKSGASNLKAKFADFTIDSNAHSKLTHASEYIDKNGALVTNLCEELDELWANARAKSLNQSFANAIEPPPSQQQINFEILDEVESRICKRKYPYLDTLTAIYKIAGVLCAILAVAGILFGLHDNSKTGLQLAIASGVAGFFVCVSLFAFAEMLKLSVDVEENSRATREYIRQLFLKKLSEEE